MTISTEKTLPLEYHDVRSSCWLRSLDTITTRAGWWCGPIVVSRCRSPWAPAMNFRRPRRSSLRRHRYVSRSLALGFYKTVCKCKRMRRLCATLCRLEGQRDGRALNSPKCGRSTFSIEKVVEPMRSWRYWLASLRNKIIKDARVLYL
jgi:hypothetical protein